MKLLQELYKKIIYLRLVEEFISNKYSEQNMRCPVHLSIGQEAIPSLLSLLSNKNDKVFSTHRNHHHYLAFKGSLENMFREMMGKANSSSGGRGGSMHLFDKQSQHFLSLPIVGSSIPIGVGSAYHSKYFKKKFLSYIFLGDATVEEGVFHESLNFASLKQLPAIFVCENNLYSVYTPLKQRQPKRDLSLLAKAHNINTINVSSKNIFSIYKKLNEILIKCRKTNTPYFINVETYRFVEHCGPNNDDHLKYRSLSEIKKYEKLDALYLLEKKLLSESKNFHSLKDKTIRDIKYKINSSYNKALKAPRPKNITKSIYEIYAR